MGSRDRLHQRRARLHLRRGNFEEAYAAAEHKFEHDFKAQKGLHLSFEPFATIADFRLGGVTIHTASQGPSRSCVRNWRAWQRWTENKVRVKVPYAGSGYCSKLYINSKHWRWLYR